MSVLYEVKGHIAILTLNRPEARNAVNGEVTTAIEAALDDIEANPDIRVAILTANGKVFCAGADLKEVSSGNARALMTKKGGFAGLVRRDRVKPLIVAISGSAVGGGTEIALACDIVVAAKSAHFGLPEVKRCLLAGAGGLFRLPRVVGQSVAMEMILTGDPISAQRAYELGLASKVVEDDQLMTEALTLAGRIADNAPLAVQASMKIASKASSEEDNTLWSLSNQAIRDIGKAEDFKEGPRAFIEKRKPVWKGR